MERVISNPFRMYNKPALRNTPHPIFLTLLIIIITSPRRKSWFCSPNNLQWLQLAVNGNSHQSPVIKATFPELSKINMHTCLPTIYCLHIPVLNFMPREQMSIIPTNRGWRPKSQEYLGIWGDGTPGYNNIDGEVLAHTADNWAECLLELPVHTVVKHVQEHNGLVTDGNLTVTLQLDEQFLNPK